MPMYECGIVNNIGGGNTEVYVNNVLRTSPLSLTTLNEDTAKESLKEAIKQIYLANGGLDAELDYDFIQSKLASFNNKLYRREVIENI